MRAKTAVRALCVVLLGILLAVPAGAGWLSTPDFESNNIWDGWSITGGWQTTNYAGISGFHGSYYAWSNCGNNAFTGVCTSETFSIDAGASSIQFLIVGWDPEHANKAVVELVRASDNTVLRTTSAPGSDAFAARSWDVSDLAGTQVYIRATDATTTGWVGMDYFTITSTGPPVPSSLVLENSHYRLTFQLTSGVRLEEIYNKSIGANMLGGGTPAKLFEVNLGGIKYSAPDLRVTQYEQQVNPPVATHILTLEPLSGGVNPTVRLTIRVDDSWQVKFGLAILNQSGSPVTINNVRFPNMQNLRVGSTVTDDWYFCPVGSGFFSDKDIDTIRPYGGGCWWHIFDVYDQAETGGLYVIVNDNQGRHKDMTLKKDTAAGAISVSSGYPFPTGVTALSEYVLPDMTLGVHSGGWRTALGDYMNWVRTWYSRRPTPSWFKNKFFLRQEALHGRAGWYGGYTDLSKYVMNPEKTEYRFVEKIDEFEPYIDIDLFHLNGWWEETQEDLGDYFFPPSRGGSQAFRDYIQPIQQEGVGFGLYWEGWLVAKSSSAGQQYGSQWSIRQQDGSEPPDYGPNFWKCCIGYAPWQDFLVNSIDQTVSATNVKGVYIDSITSNDVGPCYSAQHNHPTPGVRTAGMAQLFTKIRTALDAIDPQIASYSEEPSSDYISQFIDGSFYHRLWQGPSADPQYNKPQINLFRFYFPDFKMFEAPGYEMYPDKTKLALFNGDGLWSQVYQDDDPNAPHMQMMTRVTQVLQENADAFTTASPEPLVPTLVNGVFANKFPCTGKTLYTVYNSGTNQVSGDILRINKAASVHYVDIANLTSAQAVDGVSDRTLGFTVTPGEVTCIAELPVILSVSETGIVGSLRNYEVIINIQDPTGTLECLVIGSDGSRTVIPVDQGQVQTGRVAINGVERPAGSRLVLKLKNNGLLVDAIVADEQPGVLSGNVLLQDYVGDRSLVAVRVQLIQNSSVMRSVAILLDANGDYSMQDITPGTYDVAFKACNWLRKVVPGVAISASTPPCNVILKNGDLNGDNGVTNTDLSILLPNLDQKGREF